jgi:hypothetical protein
MRTFTPRQVMVPLVVALTALHLGVRLNARVDQQPQDVSELEAGAMVSVGSVEDRIANLPPQTCLQVIVFSPDCPFCQHAADRESDELAAGSRARRLWFTDAESANLPYFITEHLHREPGISGDLVKELKIQAVPALFVLSQEGEVRWVGSYYGDESDQELIDRCNGNHPQKT